MTDLLPPLVAKWQFVEEKARAILDAFGFQEARPPLRAPDGSLRGPGAAALIRARAHLAQGPTAHPTRLYQLGPVFAGVTGGPLEERAQLVGAAFDPPSDAVDAELVAMAGALVGEAGVPAPTLTAVGSAGMGNLLDALAPDAQVTQGPQTSFRVTADAVELAAGVRTLEPPAFTFTVDLAALVQAVPDPPAAFVAPPAAAIVASGAEATRWALAAAHRLRLAGIRLQVATSSVNASPYASRLRVTVTDRDLASSTVILEDLATARTERLPASDLESALRLRLD